MLCLLFYIRFLTILRNLTAHYAPVLNGYRVQYTLVTSRLIPSTVWIKVNVTNRLRYSETTGDEQITIGVNRCYERCVGRIESYHR